MALVRKITDPITGAYEDVEEEVEAIVFPVVIPQVISDRQFFQQLAVMGKIPKSEALAAVKTGTIPTDLQSIINLIADDDLKFEADMLLSGATQFYRDNAFVSMIGAMLDPPMTSADLDQFWLAAAQL